MTPGPGARLALADLGGADLAGVDLAGADLRGANLAGADLRGANLAGTRLEGALLAGTRADVPLAGWHAPDGAEAGWRAHAPELAALLAHPEHADTDAVLDVLDWIGIQLPGWGFAWVFAARTLREAGRDDLALDVLISGVIVDPTGPARHAMGRLLLDRGELESARPTFERLHADHPADPQIAAELGYLVGRLGDLDPARRLLEAAIAGGIAGPNTWAALGMATWGLGDTLAAGRAFGEAARRSGAAVHVLTLSRYHAALGDLGAALDVLGDAASSRDPAVVLHGAHLARQAGDDDGARILFEAALALDPQDAEAAAGLADIRAGRTVRVPVTATAESPEPPPVPLPIDHATLARARAVAPALGAFVDHVVFASPHAIGALLQHGPDTAVLLRGPLGSSGPVPGVNVLSAFPIGDGLSLAIVPGRLAPVSADVAAAVLLGRGAQPAPADAHALFDGAGLADMLAASAAAIWPPALCRRLRAFGPLLADRYGAEGDLSGPDLVIDALVPDLVLAGDGPPALYVPGSAIRRGDRRWSRAQLVAWLAVDRARFLDSGILVPGSDRAKVGAIDQPTIGLAYAVWLRYFLGLAALWPDRRARFTTRALAVVEEAEQGRLLDLVG